MGRHRHTPPLPLLCDLNSTKLLVFWWQWQLLIDFIRSRLSLSVERALEVEMWKTLLVWEMGVGLMAASVQGHGHCKLLHGMMVNFSLDQYVGVWYPLLGWSNSREGDVRGKCSKEIISNDHGNITITEESISDKAGTQSSSHHAWLDRPDEGKITMWMFHAIKVPFWVIDTDYKHWAVVYSCTGDENEYLKTLLVLGRARNFSLLWKDPEAKKSIRRSLRRSSLLKLRDLTSINQTDCTN